MQGFLFSMPVSSAVLEDQYLKRVPLPAAAADRLVTT
jgi:hypothetical protein